jgi:CRP/FNR family transcriptional regulator, dissimilatory nitrate respiration regulator
MATLSFDHRGMEVIRKAPMLAMLPDDILQTLLAQADVETWSRHSVLFEQDQPAVALYLMLDGWTKLFRMTPGGDQAVVGVFTRGDCLAEAPCLSGGTYPVTCEMVTEARVLAIPGRRIVELIRVNPEMGLAMLASTSLHLRELVEQIEELKARAGPQRLAEFLWTLAPATTGSCTIALPYEKTLIAGRLGMTPESLSRAFQRLREIGVLISRNDVSVSNVARLAEFAGRERAMAFRWPGFRAGCARL